MDEGIREKGVYVGQGIGESSFYKGVAGLSDRLFVAAGRCQSTLWEKIAKTIVQLVFEVRFQTTA